MRVDVKAIVKDYVNKSKLSVRKYDIIAHFGDTTETILNEYSELAEFISKGVGWSLSPNYPIKGDNLLLITLDRLNTKWKLFYYNHVDSKHSIELYIRKARK